MIFANAQNDDDEINEPQFHELFSALHSVKKRILTKNSSNQLPHY